MLVRIISTIWILLLLLADEMDSKLSSKTIEDSKTHMRLEKSETVLLFNQGLLERPAEFDKDKATKTELITMKLNLIKPQTLS